MSALDPCAAGSAGPKLGASVLGRMFSGLAGRYDLANRVMSLGRDLAWRRALARRIHLVDRPGRVLDLAAGTGDQIVAIKALWPQLELTGLDLSEEMMRLAQPKFDCLPEPRPTMLVGDALELDFEENYFDSVTISFGLRNIQARSQLYQQVRRVLKPGGRFLVLEMYHDRRALLAPLVNFYLRRVTPFVGGRLISGQVEPYRYLASSILAFPQPEEIAAELAGCAFEAIDFLRYNFNSVMLLWGHKAL